MLYVLVSSVMAGSLGLYYYLFKDLNFFKKHGIPHLTPLPVLGNTGPLIFNRQSIVDLSINLYNVHPDAKYSGFYDLIKPVVLLRDPELIQSIGLKNSDIFADHSNSVEEDQDPLFGKNLFSLRGKKWWEVRSVLSSAFTSSKMKSMFTLMSDCAIRFTNFLVQLPPEKRVTEMKDVFTRYTNDMIATCAFGISIDSMRDPKNKFYLYGRESAVFNNIMLLKFQILKNMPWLARIFGLKLVRTEIANFFQELVQNTIDTRDRNGIVRPDMLQLMMESRGNKDGKKELTIDDITAQAFSFFFGGFDSTSTLLCFAAHEIAVNRTIQERLQEEIEMVLENTNGQVTYEAVKDMEYLDAVIKEALRMYPVAGALERLCLKDFELPATLPELKPFTIRKGQGVWIPVYGLHHDPKYFEEPENFDPERFLGQRKLKSLDCGAYLPFGLGPRKCIGSQLALLGTKVVLFHLLARCELKPCDKTCIPIKIAKDGFNMKPEGGFWLNVLPRQNLHHTVINEIYKV